jgi:prepilin-type processing-associated H-X9-DG protein
MSGPGATVTGWTSQTSFSTIADGTSNTLLIGEKHIRPNQFQGKGEDRSVFDGNGGNFWRRFIGQDADSMHPLVSNPLDQMGPLVNQRFGSRHTGVCQFVFADGSVRAVPVNTPLDVLTYLGLPSDGMVVNASF